MSRGMLCLPLVAALSACPPPNDDDPTPIVTYDFALSGTAADNAEQRVRLAVVDAEGGVVEDAATTVAADGSFTFAFPDALDEGSTYTVDFYADVNDSDGCDAPPADEMWRLEVPAVTADVGLTWEHSTDYTDVCATFGGYGEPPRYDLAFVGTLAEHSDQEVSAAVVDVAAGTVKTTRTETVGSDGSLIMSWTRILEPGKDYTLDFYADANGNGTCDAPPDDHSWRIAIDAVAADVDIEFAHNGDWTDVCATFD